MLRPQYQKFFHIFRQKLHPSWCFYAFIWGIIVGIIFGINSHLVIFCDWLWALVSFLLLLFTLHRATYLALVLAFLSGLILANFRVSLELSGLDQLHLLTDTTITLRGKIIYEPENNAGQTKFRINNLYIQSSRDRPVENSVEKTVEKSVQNSRPVENSEWIPISGTIYVSMSSPPSPLERSDIVILTGKLGSSFGTFAASLYRPTLQGIERAETGDIFARIKSWFTDLVHDYIASPAADLGLGYLMGQKAGLSESFAEALRAVGMTHVVVASGAHLGILTGAARRIFGKISKFAGMMFAFLMMLTFVMIVGFTPSMTRAALVTGLSLGVGYVGRKFTPGRLLSFVAALTLFLTPTNFIDLGWQLSFASFSALLLVEPLIRQILYGGKKPPWLASMLLTSLATSLICAPIMLYNFGTLSFLSFVANLIILPTLPYAMLLVFLTGATHFLPLIAQVFAWLATHLLDFHIWIINYLSTKKMFILELPSGDPRVFLIYLPTIASLILIMFYLRRRRRLDRANLRSPPRPKAHSPSHTE